MGVIPNSMSVPLLLANIIRSQYSGSDVSDETIPYNGIWLITRNIMSVNYQDMYCQPLLGFLSGLHGQESGSQCLTPVHINF